MLGKHNSQNRMRTGCTLLVGFVVLSLLLIACGSAKPKTYTIGVVNVSKILDSTVNAFKEGMTKLGYVEGENVTYIYEGPVAPDKLDAVAQGLVQTKVDLILSLTTPATKATQKATAGTDIPVVFIPVTDPVGADIVASLTKPGGNITGVTYTSQEGRRLEWLLQIAPTIKEVYIVYNPKDQSPVLALKTVSETAAKLGVELITREASTIEEIEAAFKDIPKEADAIFFLPDSLVTERIADWFKLAVERKLPTSGPNVLTARDTALTAYGVDLEVAARTQAADLANRIFQGDKPADLPVEVADYFSAVNLKIAQDISLTIPDDILRQANIVVR
jgi:putative tryptophan/tyrosine transport system substrate-binding protein